MKQKCKMPYMSGSFSFNSFRTHKGRKTAKELRDRAAKQFIKNWVKDNMKITHTMQVWKCQESGL